MSSRAPTEARELPPVRASSRTHDVKVVFEIDNVLATLSSNRRKRGGSGDLREIVGPVVVAGEFKFEFRFVYGVKEEGKVDLRKTVGWYMVRVDRLKQAALVKSMVHFVNVDLAKNEVVGDDSFIDMSIGEEVGCDPPFEDAGGVLNMASILDSNQGWLHQGVLKMSWELSVVTEPDVKTTTMVDGAAAQVEVCDSLSALLKSSLFADATLVVDGERLPVHSLILSARSVASRFDAPSTAQAVAAIAEVDRLVALGGTVETKAKDVKFRVMEICVVLLVIEAEVSPSRVERKGIPPAVKWAFTKALGHDPGHGLLARFGTAKYKVFCNGAKFTARVRRSFRRWPSPAHMAGASSCRSSANRW